MSWLLGNDWFVMLLTAACVFVLVYRHIDDILDYVYRKTLGSREEISKKLDMMFVEVKPNQLTWALVLSSLGLGSIVFLAFWPNFVSGLIFGGVITYVGWTLPKLIVDSLWNSRCNKITNQMVDGMTIMANAIGAGLSITQGMERVTANMKGPLAQEFRLVLGKIRLGMSVEDALNELGERVPRQDMQMFVTAVNILKETGGNLAETFSTIVTTVRERQKVEKKIEALTTQGITQGMIITMVPFALIGVFLVVDPAYIMPLFNRPLGWFALFIMLGLQIIGGLFMKKVVTIKV